MLRRITLLVVLIAALSNVALATTYHVAKTGNNANSGLSLAQAKLTINAGVALLAAGDTLDIHVGTYDEQLGYGVIPSGTLGNIVTIEAFSTDIVTMAPVGAHINGIIGVHNSYVTLKNLILDAANMPDLTNTTDPLAVVNSSNIIIDHVTAVNSTGNGFEIGASDHVSVLSANISEIGRLGTNQYHCVYINGASPFGGGNSSDITVDGGVFHDCAGFGIHVYDGVHTLDRVIVKNASIYHSGYKGGVQNSTTSEAGLLLTDGTDQKAYNNLVYSNLGTGMQSRFGNGSTNVGMYNNTIYNNGNFDGQPGIELGGLTVNAVIQNNIFYQNYSTISDSGSGTFTHANFLVGNPLFTNAASSDFTIQAGSGTIGAADDLSSIFTTDIIGVARGSSWTQGAYQFVAPPVGGTTTGRMLRGVPQFNYKRDKHNDEQQEKNQWHFDLTNTDHSFRAVRLQ